MEFPFMEHELMQLQTATDAAETFLKQNRFGDALGCYDAAIDIAVNLDLAKEELAKIFSNRSLIFIKLGFPQEALKNAEQCISLCPDWWKGYWRAATAHKRSGSLGKCALCLADLWRRKGLSLQKEDQVQVLAEMAITVPVLYKTEDPESMHALASLDLPTDTALWSKVVQQLASTDNWEAVRTLVLVGSFSVECPLEGVAAECSAHGIVVRNLLCTLSDSDLKSWGINLAVCLLKKGADVNTIWCSPDEPVPISALITALQTGVHDLFKYTMENIPTAWMQIDNQNRFGETALHIIVKSEKINSFSGEALLKLLLNYGCRTNIRDRHGKLPIDYLDRKSTAYGILLNISQKKDENIRQKTAMLLEAGNKAHKQNDNKQALRYYEAAIVLAVKENSLKTELAILHSNCSLVYFNMGDYNNALASAHNAVTADSNYYKGHWQLGQAYKSENKFSEAFDVFISGLIQADHPDENSKTSFMLEIARLLPPLEDSGSILLNKLSEISQHYSASWLRIVETLSKYENWLSVKILVMGVNYKPLPLPQAGMVVKDTDFWPNPQGIAAKFPASSATLHSIADAPVAWADELLMVLLSQNASLETLTTSTNTPPFHTVIKMCMLAGNAALMCQVLKIDPKLTRQRQLQNDKGKTLFHIICDLSDRGESAIGVKLTQILLDYRFDANVRDNSGLRPQDLVPCFSSLGRLLSSDKHGKPSEPSICENLDVLSRAKLFKEEGNKEFNNQNYPAAVCHYNEAIKLHTERKDSISDLTQEERHDLSVLYGNRAECFLKLGLSNEALHEAKQSVGYDPTWHKAQVRVGHSFQALNNEKKALKAFVKAYNLLPATADNSIQTEILSEIIILFHKVESKGKYSQLIPGLNPVKDLVWVLTAYNFISQNHIWEHAYMAFKQIKRKTVKLSLDLKPFCKKKVMRNHVWSLDFILMLLQNGSDHRTLSFDDGDTYLQAGALTYFLTGMNSVFKWLVDNKALPLNELNIQDRTGNTVLHFAVMTDCNIEYKDYVVSLLLKSGANPLITNNLQKKALECLRSGDKRLKMHFESAEKDVCKVQPSKPLQKKNEDSLVGCQVCEKLVADAKDLITEGENTKGIKNLVEVIKKSHRETKHQQLSAQSADIIVDELGKMLNPDIPDCMTSLSAKHYKAILEKFAKKDKWRQIVAAVKKYDSKHGKKKLPTFAANISLVQLVKSSSLRGSESLRLKILNLISSHGAVLQVDDVSMLHAAVSQLEFRVVKWLIDHGVSPSFFSLTLGDTPVHAAVTVALEKDEGNFQLFDKFLSLYKEDSEKYKFLDPSRQDKDGNSLLHIACRCRFSKHSLKAVERLCELKVPLDVTNNEGKMAVQYLTYENDRRAQFMHVAVPPSTQPKMKTSSAGNLKINHPSSHKAISKKKQNKTSFNRDSGIRVSSVKNKTVQRCKEDIEKLINNLSDCKSDDSKQHGSKQNEYVSQTTYDEVQTANSESAEEVETACSESAEERIAAEKSDNEQTNEKDVNKKLDWEEDEEGSVEEIEIDPKVFDNLEWEVECTAEVWKTLKDKHVPLEMKQRVIRRIKLLASGEWRTLSHYSVPNAPPTLNLFEAKLSKAARIIWELAIAFSPRLSEAAKIRLETEANNSEDFAVKNARIYSEIIRVWDIVLDHDHLNRAIEKIIKSHNRGNVCILQRKLKGVKDDQFRDSKTEKRIPMLFAEAEDNVDLSSLRKLYPPASPQDTEYHILKFYSFSSALVLDILQNHEIKVDFPFRVTDTEHAIINLETNEPLLLLGRSGTGKTTCCLYRLWTVFTKYWTKAKEASGPLLPREQQFIKETGEETEIADDDVDTNTCKLYDDATLSCTDSGILREESSSTANNESDAEEEEEYTAPGYVHLHQLFVTKNSVLCAEVHKNFNELCHASDVAEDHVKMENEILPHRLQDVNDFLYPLFLTSKQLLLILDASLGPPYFFERNDDGSLKVVIQGWGTQDDLFGFTPLDHEFHDELSNEDIDIQNEAVTEELHGTKEQKLDPRREVTYEVFAAEVWPKIKKKMSVSYHPALVWTEIVSFIRGSFEALTKPNGILKKDEYIDLGRKRAPNFTGERDKIYQLFLRYDHFKTQNFLFDELDLIYSIHKRLRKLKQQPWILHQIYVDETQDFTQAELAVLIRITQNPNNMFLTGDTAQSIMRGISFRFSDLKSLFYHAKKSQQSVGKIRSIKVPKQVYQLTHNYRSHTGILSLASAILDLMAEFFPDSFDCLQKDQGLFHGPPPVLLESCSPSDLAILLQGHKRKTSHIEFGAHQAILVVNEEARDSIPEELRLGLILTICEAKGLEFDDVLLYNFFKDSYASKEWRIVTDYVDRIRENLKDKHCQENLVILDEEVLKQPHRPRPLTFDSSQHKVLNSELKHLYTALTRARVNVWIFDESEEKRAPMFEYFKARDLVHVVSTDSLDSDSNIFAEKSGPAEWEKRGDELMKRSLYDVAAKCYKMAGCENKEKIAQTHSQAMKASRMKDTPQRMYEEYMSAAKTFLECDVADKAALCLQNAHEYELAAQTFEKCGLLLPAAKMYSQSKKILDCSRCYEQLGYFNKATDILYKEELFDQAIDCLRRHKMILQHYQSRGKIQEHPPQEAYTEERLTYKSAEKHHRSGNKAKMIAVLGRLTQVNLKINFLIQHNYHDEAAEYLIDEGKTTEAVQLLLKNGKIQEALAAAEKGQELALIGECHLILSQVLRANTDKMQEAEIHLNRALESFQAADDKSGLGKTLVILAQIRVDKALAKRAYRTFSEEKPFANEAGMLEALQVYLELSHFERQFEDTVTVIHGIEKTFRVIEQLFQQTSLGDKERAQMYYRFFGLYQNATNTSVFEIHPKEKPYCIELIEDFFVDAKEKKERIVQREKSQIFVSLSRVLIRRMKEWLTAVEYSLQQQIQHHVQCKMYIQGSECEDIDVCPYMHEMYNQSSALKALNIFARDVSLSYIVQSGVDMIRKLGIKDLSEEVGCLVKDETKFDSCEHLLNFLMPEHRHPKFLSAVLREIHGQWHNSNMSKQIFKYLENLWLRPTKKVKKDVWKQRCRSTEWVLQIFFFSSLMKLNLDVTQYCQKLEKQLMADAPKWLADHSHGIPYALFAEDHKGKLIVECLANRFIEAIYWLKQRDPMESIIKFTKFIRILSIRDRPYFLPTKAMMLFWMEIFVILSFFLLAKLSETGTHFIVPETYLDAVTYIDLTFEKHQTLQSIVHEYTPKKNVVKLLWDRSKIIIGLVCGYRSRMSLLSLFFTGHKNDFCAAERCLVLTLVILVNVGALLPDIFEDHIMKSILRIQLPDKAPKRLLRTLNAVNTAKGLSDIAAILKELLLQREDDHLLDCFWNWNNAKQEGVQIYQVTDLSWLPKQFFIFSPTQDNVLGSCSMLEKEGYLLDEKDMTPEEHEIFQREYQLLEIREKQNKAAKIIQRFFRNITMKYRIENLGKRALKQEMIDMFAPYSIQDTFCGVCGVPLKSDTDPQNSSLEDIINPEGTVETHIKHILSEEHIEKTLKFDSFKQLYYDHNMRKFLHEVKFFIGFHKLRNKEMKAKWYADISLDIDRLLSEMDSVNKILENIMEKRSWEKIEELTCALFVLYQDYLFGRVVIVRKFREYKESLNEESKDSPVTEQLEPSPDIDFMDNDDLHEDVVPDPHDSYQLRDYSGHQYKRGGGRGRGRGRQFGHNRQQLVGPTNLPPRLQRQLNMI